MVVLSQHIRKTGISYIDNPEQVQLKRCSGSVSFIGRASPLLCVSTSPPPPPNGLPLVQRLIITESETQTLKGRGYLLTDRLQLCDSNPAQSNCWIHMKSTKVQTLSELRMRDTAKLMGWAGYLYAVVFR